jgi:hypothetical protein
VEGGATVQFNPKFGVLWNPFPNTALWPAAFRTLNKTLLNSSTLEPTHVAGFNQFYDDTAGTRAWKYGAAVDQKFSSTLFAGVEYSQRDLEVPFLLTSGEEKLADWNEMLVRSYLYWVPTDWVALTAEYQFERLARDTSAGTENLWNLDTHRIPLGIGFFHPSGFLSRLKTTYVNQSGEFPGTIQEPRVKGAGGSLPARMTPQTLSLQEEKQWNQKLTRRFCWMKKESSLVRKKTACSTPLTRSPSTRYRTRSKRTGV